MLFCFVGGFEINFFLLIRLSYHQRIKDMMPEPYAKLIPIPSNPCYKYTSEGAGEFIFFVFNVNEGKLWF